MPNPRNIALKIGYGPQDNRLRDFAEAKVLPETRLRPLTASGDFGSRAGIPELSNPRGFGTTSRAICMTVLAAGDW
jgi:hypothetical protein